MQFGNTFALSVGDPLDAFPSQGTLQARYLRGLKTVVLNMGGDPQKVLEHHDIDPLAFESPDHHIECTAAVDLVEDCSRVLHAPLFGLHLAEQQDPDVFGCATTLAMAAPNLRQSLQSFVDYVPVSASPECELELVTARDVVELRWRTDTGLGYCEQSNYQGLLLIMKTLRLLGRQHFRPRYATLAFAIKRSDIQLLEDRVGCKIIGNAGNNAIAFPADILGCPLPSSGRIFFIPLENCDAQLRSASKAGFVEQVEAQVRSALSTGQCSVDGCAGKLGTSARTLQKRLARMDIKFSDIVQNERTKLAKQALLWSDSTLDEIAFQLGYSEQTSFGRACKRSTGMTPQAFRNSENRRRWLGTKSPGSGSLAARPVK